MRADLRFLYPFGRTTAKKMPLDERIFLGGDNLIRGYRPYKLVLTLLKAIHAAGCRCKFTRLK